MRVLVVDDDPSSRAFVEKVLRADYKVTAVDSGEQALALLERGELFDLALIDQRMPGMQGSDLLARLKAAYPAVVRLVVTAHAEPSQIVDAINRGEVYRYVIKPFTAESLRHTVAQALERRMLERHRDELIEQLRRANLDLQEAKRALESGVGRGFFMDRLSAALARAKGKPEHLFAVLLVDIDRFKVFNHALGQAAGDQMLADIAARLRGMLDRTDIIVRLEADRYAILAEGMGDFRLLVRLADRVRGCLQETPFRIGSQELTASASIGIAVSATNYERGEDMLSDAETALRKAKASGGACYEVFDTELRARLLSRLRLEIELSRAIQHDELRVHFQPIVGLADGGLTALEALVRWQHPEHGLIPPDEFIPIAEESGQIVALGGWVLRAACEQARLLQERHPKDALRINVNVSARQFHQYHLFDQVTAALRDCRIDPRSLCLEITETVLMRDLAASKVVFSALKQLGVRVVLDDFGVGHSSLSYLGQFPVDGVKIDTSFVRRLGTGDDTTKLVGAIVHLAHNLDMPVTAEGVETDEQWGQLSKMGCDFGQGYYFSRPVPVEGVEAVIGRAPWSRGH